MDVSGIPALSTAMAGDQLQNEASVSVLRKSLDAESSMALQLIQAISVPGVGENVDLHA